MASLFFWIIIMISYSHEAVDVQKILCSQPGKEPTWLKSLKHQIKGLMVGGFLSREDKLRKGLRLLSEVTVDPILPFWSQVPLLGIMLMLQSVFPKFFMIDLGLWFSAHICPQVVYTWPLWAHPWRYWKRLYFYFHEAWKLLPSPFRNVIVKSFQYKEVLLGAPNYVRSVYWWRFLTEATRGCLDCGPLCSWVCTNGLSVPTAC